MSRALLFDLDGTLLPLDQDVFTDTFLSLAVRSFAGREEWGGKAFPRLLMRAVEAVVRNDGSVTNEERFWQAMEAMLPGQSGAVRDAFLTFYAEVFPEARRVTFPDPAISALLGVWRDAGIPLLCATSPIFPPFVQEMRLRWAGFDRPEDWFLTVTSSENCTYAKPNPLYYTELCAQNGLRPEDCLMVGNDADEDGAALQAGMRFFFLSDHPLNRKGIDLTGVPQGSWNELRACVRDWLQESETEPCSRLKKGNHP